MSSSGRIPVIIDTDPGVDDIIAILFALASPEIEILAIIVSFGNTDIESSYSNILKLYGVLEKHFDAHPEERARYPNFASSSKPILVAGSRGPLEGELHSAQYFHGRDGLGGINEQHPEICALKADKQSYLRLSNRSAVDVSLDLLREFPERQITYIALGPLTNLAHLVREDKDLVTSHIGRIICMGGALDVPGNTTPVAEFNFFADPFAVKELLVPGDVGVGLPLDRFVLLPLDITTPHELPFQVYIDKVDNTFEGPARPSQEEGKKTLTHFTSSFLEKTRSVMLEFGKDAMELHDIVAVWCAIANPPGISPSLSDGWLSTKRVFQIERFGELTRGMLVVDKREDETAYAPGVNRANFQAEVDKQGISHGNWESTAVPAEVEIEAKTVTSTTDDSGVSCVYQTPGPAELLSLLLDRVWGV